MKAKKVKPVKEKRISEHVLNPEDLSSVGFNKCFESIRTKRLIEGMSDVMDILKSIYNKEIDLKSKKVHDGLRNEIYRIVHDYKEIYAFESETELIEFLIKNPEDRFSKTAILNMTKDPLRQNLSEELQKEASKFIGVEMSKSVIKHDTLHLYKAKIVKGSELSKVEKKEASKSFDFIVDSINGIKPTKIIYTLNKYNKWVGGSTDNVKQEAINFCLDCKKNTDDVIFLLILDGDYWDINRKSLSHYASEKLIITCTDDMKNVAQILEKI